MIRNLIAVAFLSSALHADQVDIKAFPALGRAGGRFVLGQLSPMRQDQFLLDTLTGRVWQLQENQKGERVMVEIRAICLDGTIFPPSQASKPKK